MNRSDRTLMGFVRVALGSQRARQRAALLAFAILAPACGGGGGGGGFFPTPGVISFQLAAFTVNEPSLGTATATITVTRSGGVGAVSVNYATSNGTAGAADYTAANGTLAWANGDVVDKTFTVTVANDVLVEGNETVNLTLSGPTGGAVLGLSSAVLTIVDEDAPVAGVLQFSAATYSVVEGTPSVTITVTRTGGTTNPASVDFSDAGGGSATGAGTDYTLTPGTLNWAAGDGASKTFTVAIVDNGTPEPTETVNLQLTNVTGAALGTTTTAVLSIIDNDSPSVIQFNAAAFSVSESGVTATIVATRTGGAGGVVGVTFASSDGSAAAGTDYTAANGTLSWADGDTADKTFPVSITDNLIVDGNRTVNLTLSVPTGTASLGAQSTAVLTIQDDDCTLQFTAATYNIPESAGASTIVTVSRLGSTAGAVSVDFSNPAGGSATAGGTDYTFVAGTLNWAIGDGANKTISIPINADALPEGNQDFNLALSNAAGVGAHLGAVTASVATIVDDDVSFVYSLATYSGSEGGGAITVTVNRVGASNGIATVDWTITGGTATIALDYTGVPATLTWPSGDVAPKTFTIVPVVDNTAENNETVLLGLANPTLVGGNSVTLGAQNTATLTIVDDDTNLAFSSATYSGAEGAGAIVVTVNRTGVTTGTSTVVWSIQGSSTATIVTDYAATPGTLTFNPGDTTKTFTITPGTDNTVEGSETVDLLLSTPVGATLVAPTTATVTIIDIDVPSASINDVTLTEGDAGTKNFTFTITLSVPAVVAGSVTVNTANGTVNPATAGVDYTAIVNQLVTFNPTDVNKTVTVIVNGDTTDELNETFFVNLSAPVNLNITDAQGLGTITNDDDPTISIANNSTTEGNAGTKTLAFTMTLSHASLQDVVVTYSTANGTAVAPGDYTAVAGGTATITAGNLTAPINITINGDTTDEADETFTVTMATATNTASITTPTATGTITNDDDPTITIAGATTTEGSGGGTKVFNFQVTLSNPSLQDVVVTYSTADVTAIAPGDYTAVALGTVTILGGLGNTTANLPVTVQSDNTDETNETFTVTINNVTNATISGSPTATGTIIDDDGPSLTITNVTQPEGNSLTSNFVFTVNVSVPSPQAISVDFTTVNGTATGGSDFVGQVGTLNIPALAASGTITIVVNGDTASEPDETFAVVLSNPVNATISGSTGIGTILTDDLPGISITPSVSHNEGNAATTSYDFVVSLTNAPTVLTGAVSVNFQTNDVTANAGSDYTALPLTPLNWPVGDSSTRTITVLVNGDTSSEPDETFNVTLSGAVNANMISGTGVGTIVNDDGPAISISGPVATPEGNGGGTTPFVFTVSLSSVPTSTVTVNFSTADGSATTADGDYVSNANTLIWLAGNGAAQTITVLVNRDNKLEADETFSVNLSVPVGGSISVPSATGTIQNDDPVPTISINDVTLAEGNGGPTLFTFNVTLSNPSFQTVTVLASTGDGSATLADNDYQQVTNQLVSFPPGNTSQNVTVTVNGDVNFEPNETFNVLLSSPTFSSILDGTGVGTISNDEGPTVTNAVPANGSPGVSAGTNLDLDFSMAMDPASFVSGTTVTITPDPSGGLVPAANRIQFFWNVAFTHVTIVFDTAQPVGIFGDDVLAGGTAYTVTLLSGAGGVKSSVGTGNVPMVSPYNTTFTTFTTVANPTYTIAPGVTANTPVPALTTVFTITFSQAMNITFGQVQIQNNYGYQVDAQIGDTFPHNGIQSMVWSGGNTVMTVTLTTGIPGNAIYRFQVQNFNGATGGFLNNNNDIVFVTPGPVGTAPTVTARLPAPLSTVTRDNEILIGFSAPMHPSDLLDNTKLTVSGAGVVAADLSREIVDFSGVFIRHKGGWPASTITVTINNTIRNAALVTIAATSSYTFNVSAADTTAMTVDGPYSSLPTGSVDLDTGSISANWALLRGGGNRAFPNELTLAPQDVSLSESAAPFIPIKGFTLRGDHGLELQPSSNFTGLKYNTGYKVTINPTFKNTHGGVMSLAGSANVITFTTKLNLAAVARPQIFSGGGDSRYETRPGKVKADLRVDAYSPTGTPLVVTGSDSPNVAFAPVLTNGGGGSNYQYQSGVAGEAALTTVGDHFMTYTIADGTHSPTVKEKLFVFDTTVFPTLTTPAGGTSTPTMTWSALTAPMQAQAPGFALGIVKVGNQDPSYIVLLPPTSTTFTVPADQALPSGSYQFLLHFFHPTDGVFQGASSEGETNMSGTFIVP